MGKLESQDQSLHFIERVNMAFLVEMCILPKETSFTWLKISGNIPRLHLNLSDRKYRALLKTLDLINYGFSSTLVLEDSAQIVSEEVLDEWSYQGAMSPVLNADEFFDAEEDLSSVASAELEAESLPQSVPQMDASRLEMARVVVEFSFNVGEVSASLRKSGTHSLEAEEKKLADLNIYDFDLKYTSRPFDFKTKITIASAEVVDNMQMESAKFQYLMSQSRKEEEGESGNRFITIGYDSIQRDSPDFNGTDQIAEIGFGGIYIPYQV